MDFVGRCVRLWDWSLSWIPLRCVNLFGNGSGTDLYLPFVSPTRAWNPGAGLTAALGWGDDAVGRILAQMRHSASEVRFQRCSAHISDFRLILRSFGLRFSLWYQAVFFFPQVYIWSARMRITYRAGVTSEEASCQANMTGKGSGCWSGWIVYYPPAVKQQTSICSFYSQPTYGHSNEAHVTFSSM